MQNFSHFTGAKVYFILSNSLRFKFQQSLAQVCSTFKSELTSLNLQSGEGICRLVNPVWDDNREKARKSRERKLRKFKLMVGQPARRRLIRMRNQCQSWFTCYVNNIGRASYNKYWHINIMHEQDQRNVVDPTSYAQWYSTLPEEHLPYYYTPAQYYQWYYYSQVNPLNYTSSNYPQHGQNVHQNKQKLSRNQKRKLKKKELEQEYEKEKKQLGKWVDLERKDLVDQIKKIDEKELKIKEKKKEKLSHLIQIHKEVYKHMLKKNRGRIGRNEQVGNFRRKKKKPSHIKRMKQLYEEIKDKVKEPRKDEPRTRDEKASNEEQRQEDYVTESQSQNEGEQRVGQMTEARVGIRNHGTETERNKQEEAMRKQIKVIEYKRVGKLNGCVYNGITLREWVDHVPSTKLEDIVLRLINRLAYKQAIKKITHPEKARKSIIAGFHECRRTLWTKIDKKKSKLLVVALNIERNNFERGTDDQLQQVLWYAHEAEVPVIHISTRSKIGRAFTGKFGPRIAMVSVINYEGYQDMMEVVMEEWRELKKIYDTTNESMLKF